MDLEKQRAKAQTLFNDNGITVIPYGDAWWLLGEGVSRVVGELAGLSPESLVRFHATQR